MEEKIMMVHGSGGRATSELIAEIFAKEFDNDTLNEMEDSAVVEGSGYIAMTTDSFVVTPVEFAGGDIGRLAVCGTVNDLLMRGATPRYLTCGFILQEGVAIDTLKRVVHSMAETAREAGVKIVAGDTKVVNGSGEFYINTAGVGFVPECFPGTREAMQISAKNCQTGDAILLSGTLGDHHATILSQRMGIQNDIQSDCAPLGEMVSMLLQNGIHVHTLRDVTRGGLATVLKELAVASGKTLELEQKDIPVTPAVKDFCGLMGLDPLYMGNEGKLVALVPMEEAQKALEIIRKSKYGAEATLIGRVTDTDGGRLLMHTPIGGVRNLEVLMGEGLPRIC